MSGVPLPVIGIVLAIVGFILTRLLAPTKRRALSAMRPEFERTALDEDELGNEAMDMDLVHRVESENQRLAATNGYRRNGRMSSGQQTQAAFEKHLGDRK